MSRRQHLRVSARRQTRAPSWRTVWYMARTTVLRSIGLLLSLALATTVGLVSTATPVGADADPPVVILYGDSLAWESQDRFAAAVTLGTNAAAIGRSFGGTAPCDYLDTMRDDALKLRPAAVVLEFSGNRFSACMTKRCSSVSRWMRAVLRTSNCSSICSRRQTDRLRWTRCRRYGCMCSDARKSSMFCC